MQQRLEHFLKEEGLSKTEFAEKIDVSKAIISHIISGRNQPGRKFIMNTMNAFPDLNMDWLLYGKGDMYNKLDSSNEIQSERKGLFDDLDDNSQKRTELNNRIISKKKSIRKIIVLFDDNSFEEFS